MWADNQYRDVDFIAQELKRVSVQVRLKPRSGGQALWEQVEPFVSEICQSDCCVVIAADGSARSLPSWRRFSFSYSSVNIHARDGISEGVFVAMRKARDATLEVPTLILPRSR